MSLAARKDEGVGSAPVSETTDAINNMTPGQNEQEVTASWIPKHVPATYPYRPVDLSRFVTPAARLQALRNSRTLLLQSLRTAEMAMDGIAGEVHFDLRNCLQSLSNHAQWTLDELERFVETGAGR